MFDFSGEQCPVCGNVFSEKDDIVVCPICGAPHHRECYKAENKCFFDDKHSEGFEWTSSGKSADTETAFRDEPHPLRICRNCGSSNSDDALYCSHCEAPLFDDDGQSYPFGSQNVGRDGFFTVGTREGAISDGELIENIPVGDIKKFIGASWYYYVPQFLYFARNCKKASINLAAFLAHGIWFISRKMYLPGALVLLVMAGTRIFQSYIQLMLNPGGSVSYAEAFVISERFVASHPFLALGSVMCTVIQFAVVILCGIFGNRIYMSYCINKTKKLNSASESAEQFNASLAQSGGVALIPAISSAAIYFLVCYAANYFMYTNLVK